MAISYTDRTWSGHEGYYVNPERVSPESTRITVIGKAVMKLDTLRPIYAEERTSVTVESAPSVAQVSTLASTPEGDRVIAARELTEEAYREMAEAAA